MAAYAGHVVSASTDANVRRAAHMTRACLQ